MPIVRTGAFFEDNQTFTYGFSDASGSLEISGGDGLTLSSSSGAGPYLSAGRSGSGVLDPAAVGTISLRDTGTVLEVISAGSATHGASLAIARGDDTRGLMQITDGAMFRLTDPTGPDNSDATDGGETGWIGRGARAEGALSLRAGEFIFSGTGSNLSVGREGGTGSVSMTDGSGFVMETTSAGEDDFTHLRIGINDGIGQFDMVESFALVQAGLNAGAAVDVGRFGGTGSLTIAGSSAPPFRDGLFLVGQAYSPLVELRVGLQDGAGNLNMTGGTLAVANSGVEVLRDGGSARWPGDGALGGGAALSVGREGGTGSLMAEESATLFIGGLEYTTALIGVGDRALGEVILDASSMRVVSFEGTGGLQIGEWQGGESTGRMTLRNEADSSVEGRESAYAIVGRWEGSDGMLVIQDGSSLSLNSESGSASLQVGLDEGEGRATLSGAGSSIELVALETYFRVGENGGTGHVTAGAGSTIALNALTSQAAVTIGAGGGAGSLVLDNASLSAQSLGYEAGLMVGEWHTGGATGTLELRNGATAVVQGAEGVFANVGRRAENEGFVSILSGSRLDLIGDDNTSANMRIGRNEGAGWLEINGADSLLRLAGDLTLGREGGAGTGEVENGGAIENQRTGFTATRIGQHEGSEGTLTLLGGSVMTRSLGMHDARIDVGVEGGEGRLTLDEGAVVTLHAGRYAAFSVGVAPGSDGSIAVAGQSTVSILSDAGNTDLDIGRGGEATGLVELSNSMLDMQAPLTGQGETFAWILIGTEGGTGTAVFDNSSADLRAAQGAGFRIGTRWTHTEDNTGDGTLILRDGAAVTVSSGGESADFWVGGGLGSTGRVEITSGSVLDLGGNGLLQAGHATPDMIGGGTGSVLISGAGSLVTGLRGVDLGRGGSDGSLTIADGARVMAGGLEAARNVNVDIGFDPDSRGTLTITNALFSAQMGPGAQEEFEFLGASVNFGRNGGTAQAVITGARMTDPDAQHGFIALGHAKSDYTDITIAEGTGAQADVSVSGAFFGARNDGTSFGVDGPIDLPGNGGYAAVRIGLNGGIGHLDLSDRSTLYAISGGADQSAEIVVGSGSNAAATLTVMNETQVDIIARQFDAWLLAGTEGGATGTISIADSSVLIDAARNGGIRLGTSWFDTADQVGTGNLDVLEGSDVTIRAAGNQALVHVGGGADSLAQMTLSDSALTLEGNAHRLVVVGGTPAFLPGTGGQGQLLLEGASTRLEGARDVTVGVNGATGTLELRAGATLALVDEGGGVEGRTLLGVGGGRVRADEANTFADGTLLVAGAETEITLDAADRAFVAIGTGGGTGRATLSQGARLALEADVTAVEIGVTGGAGHVDILGSGTELVVAGADGRIHVGRERNPDMTGDGPARGVLRIGEGAEVQVQTKVEIGDSTAHSALLAMEGGRLVTPLAG
jgi:T5SS/PEP-CTERM-associated repeat protein